MVVAQAVVEAADETQNPVDYYAGIAALCVVILFAKFNTHAARGKKRPESEPGSERGSRAERRARRREKRKAESKEAKRARRRQEAWSALHVFSIFFAWLATALSLVVLGWGDVSQSFESAMRWSVAFFAAVASIILALDVFNQR